jgi:hypothetical protein
MELAEDWIENRPQPMYDSQTKQITVTLGKDYVRRRMTMPSENTNIC